MPAPGSPAGRSARGLLHRPRLIAPDSSADISPVDVDSFVHSILYGVFLYAPEAWAMGPVPPFCPPTMSVTPLKSGSLAEATEGTRVLHTRMAAPTAPIAGTEVPDDTSLLSNDLHDDFHVPFWSGQALLWLL